MPKEIFCAFGMDVDAVAGWLGSYGGEDSPCDISRGLFAGEVGRMRLHFDVNATDRDQDAELERLLKLGARPADVGQTGEEPWHCLADPEGNEFCLLKARLS